MAFRVSFYCALFLSLALCAEALDCYTQVSCSGAGCGGATITTDLEETECSFGLDVCVAITTELMVEGDNAKTATLSCGVDPGLGKGCFGLDDLPSTVAAAYQNAGFDSFEYCLCDQDLCNGSIQATYTLSVIIGSLLVTLGAFFRQV